MIWAADVSATFLIAADSSSGSFIVVGLAMIALGAFMFAVIGPERIRHSESRIPEDYLAGTVFTIGLVVLIAGAFRLLL